MDFPVDGREQYVPKMLQAGYVEYPGYTASNRTYCCFNCPYMSEDAKSPTGYWCAYGWPDREFGCCNLWKPKRPASAEG